MTSVLEGSCATSQGQVDIHNRTYVSELDSLRASDGHWIQSDHGTFKNYGSSAGGIAWYQPAVYLSRLAQLRNRYRPMLIGDLGKQVRRLPLVQLRSFVLVAVIAAVVVVVLGTTSATAQKTRAYAYTQPIIPPESHGRVRTPKMSRSKFSTHSAPTPIWTLCGWSPRAPICRPTSRTLVVQAQRNESAGVTRIVRAYGLFQPVTTPPGASGVSGSRDGWVIVDDNTGQAIGYGWPSMLLWTESLTRGPENPRA